MSHLNRSALAATLVAVCAGLGACSKTPDNAGGPRLPQATALPVVPSAPDPSVPDAQAALAAAAPAQGTSSPNSSLGEVEKSTAMPMPGQANDHSSPVGPGKAPAR